LKSLFQRLGFLGEALAAGLAGNALPPLGQIKGAGRTGYALLAESFS
jgi:hypothetical protein